MKHLLLPVAVFLFLSGCSSPSSGPQLLPRRDIWGALHFVRAAPRPTPAEREVLTLLANEMTKIAAEKFRSLPRSPLPQTNLLIQVSFDGVSGYKLVRADAGFPPQATTLALEALNEASKAIAPSEAWTVLSPKIGGARFIFQ